jgi:hypothetical protein
MVLDDNMIRLDVYFVEMYAVGIEIAEHISVFSLISEIGAQLGVTRLRACTAALSALQVYGWACRHSQSYRLLSTYYFTRFKCSSN